MESASPSKISILSAPAVKFGLIGGLIASSFSYAYLFNERLFLSQEWSLAPIPIIFILAIYAGVEKKRQLGDHIRYDMAVTTIFGAMLVAILLSTILNVLLFFAFDAKLLDDLAAMIKQQQYGKLKAGKITQQQYDAVQNSIKVIGPGKMMLIQMLEWLLLSACFGLILALIISIFVRKEIKA